MPSMESPAYLVVYAIVTDREAFNDYSAQALALIESMGGKRVSLGKATVLEGETLWRGGAIYVWPSRTSAEVFWNSKEYEALKALRKGAAHIEAVLL